MAIFKIISLEPLYSDQRIVEFLGYKQFELTPTPTKLSSSLDGVTVSSKFDTAMVNDIREEGVKARIKIAAQDSIKHYEVRARGEDGTIHLNQDIEVIEGAHTVYLGQLQKVLKGVSSEKSKSYKKNIGKPTRGRNYANATSSEYLFGTRQKHQCTKLIAMSKAAYLRGTAVKDITDDSYYGLCFGGHWVHVNMLTGDHAYDADYVEGRIYEHVGDVSNQGLFPEDFSYPIPARQTRRAPSELMLLYYLLDARNIVGLCGECNGKKKGDYLKWLLVNNCYGAEFINQHFPLNYSTIIPRTRDGQGLADAMIYHFLFRAAAHDFFNFKRITIGPPVDLVGSANESEMDLSRAIDVVEENADKLEAEEQAQLRRLLRKLAI
ncbi:hypothetical protein ACFL96_15060 [Thermoproteota archaeon]